MRETKFRAWDEKLKRMFYDGDKYYPEHFDQDLKAVTGKVIVTHCGLYFWVHETQLPDATDRHFDHSSIRKIDSQVTMQFMGESDKNGKEIWESDILAPMDNDFRPEYKGNWVVIFDGGTFAAEGNSERISTWIPYWIPEEQIEIIGNIYENPKLLKGV